MWELMMVVVVVVVVVWMKHEMAMRVNYYLELMEKTWVVVLNAVVAVVQYSHELQ